MTILFKDDWLHKHPEAIADLTTKNKSFIRYAALLKKMGIDNHMWPLALHDKKLQGIDPHDPNITFEMQERVAVECRVNSWYYFREVFRVPAQAGGDATYLEANRANMALYWSFHNHIFTILIQPRQTGKSLSTDGLMVLLLEIQCTDIQINLLTKDDTLRSQNIQRIKDIESELPYYLRQRNKLDTNNTEEVSVKSLGNYYRAHVPQKSAKMAYNVGRGLTSPIFQIDEGPFQSNIGISLPAALAAGVALREKAALNGTPYGTIFTTTAGKKDDRDGKYCYNLVSESAEWTEQFLDTPNEIVLRKLVMTNSRVSKESPRGVYQVNITMNHRQLGKTDEWLAKAIADTKSTGEDADRDFGNIWTSGNESHPLSLTDLDTIKNSKEGFDHTSISKHDGLITRWYIPEEGKENYLKTNQFILSMDPSDGGHGDSISFLLQDIKTGATIAAGTYNQVNLIVISQWVCDWLAEYSGITAIIERRSSGAAILDFLLLMLPSLGIDPFKRLFNRIVNEHTENRSKYEEILVPLGRRPNDIYVRYKSAFGFATSGSGITSRSELYSTTLRHAAKRLGAKVKDSTTINQIAGLVTRNGRVDHEVGENDDMVIAFLLGFWMLSSAQNVSFYGINSKDILCEAKEVVYVTEEEYYQGLEQQNIRNQIEAIYAQLKTESEPLIIEKLEMELYRLDRKVILQETEQFSVDNLIQSLREARRKKISNLYRVNDQYNNSNQAYSQKYVQNDPRKFSL